MNEPISTTKCGDCLQSHFDQFDKYPNGAWVFSLVPISTALDEIQVGTMGKVLYHTNDGRAIIDFKGHNGTHTFHYPDGYIARCHPKKS